MASDSGSATKLVELVPSVAEGPRRKHVGSAARQELEWNCIRQMIFWRPDFFHTDLTEAERRGADIRFVSPEVDHPYAAFTDGFFVPVLLKAGGRIARRGVFSAGGYKIYAWVEVDSEETDSDGWVKGKLANRLPCDSPTLGRAVMFKCIQYVEYGCTATHIIAFSPSGESPDLVFDRIER